MTFTLAELKRRAEYSHGRIAFAKKLRLWGLCPQLEEGVQFMGPLDQDKAYLYMIGLFGFTSSKAMIDCFTEEHMKKLDLLNGSHGYALLKAMEARCQKATIP